MEKVALFPSSHFIAKNQPAREGYQIVSPVTIPALTTIADRQFKEDRTLCLARDLEVLFGLNQRPERVNPYSLFPSRKDIPQTSDPLLSLLG